MAQLVVRGLEEAVKVGLRRRAKRHGRSVEEEVREILRNAARGDPDASAPLGSRLAARDRDIPELRGETVRPASFET
jgi:plasmid stability protein